jgi:hypothetical protein
MIWGEGARNRCHHFHTMTIHRNGHDLTTPQGMHAHTDRTHVPNGNVDAEQGWLGP